MARRTAQRGLPTHTREPIRLHDPGRPPRIWTLLLTQSLGGAPSLTRTLWQLFRTTAPSHEIGVVVRSQTRQDRQSMQDLLALLTPRRLFTLLAIISPEGQPRDRQVLALEAVILSRARGPSTWR